MRVTAKLAPELPFAITARIIIRQTKSIAKRKNLYFRILYHPFGFILSKKKEILIFQRISFREFFPCFIF